QRSQNSVAAEVEDPLVGSRDGVPLVVQTLRCGNRLQKPSDLGGADVLLAGAHAEGDAEAAFRQAQPVVGRGVEVAHAELPGSVDCRARLAVGHLLVQVPELCAAERQLAQGGSSTSEGALRGDAHTIRTYDVLRWRASTPRAAPGSSWTIRGRGGTLGSPRSCSRSSHTESSAVRSRKGAFCRPSLCSASSSASAGP